MPKDESKKVVCREIIEIAGFPKEHVDQTMQNVVNHLKKQENFKLLSHKTFPSEKIKEMFSTFTEFELEFPRFDDILDFAFAFLPSSIEILKGKENFNVSEVTGILNDTLAQLHKYDMVVKNLRLRVMALEKEVGKVSEQNS